MTVLRAGEKDQISLPAFNTLTIVASAAGSGNVVRKGDKAGEQSVETFQIVPSETRVVGPFSGVTQHLVEAYESTLTTTIAAATYLKIKGASFGDINEYAGAGAPAATARGTLTVNPTGDDNGLIFTSVAYGAPANDISIEYADPGAISQALSVTVRRNAIKVNLATNGSGTITSTAAAVKAAIEAKAEAAALVTVAIMTADSGSADDGTGVVTAMARTPLASGAGVGVGEAGICSRYSDITNGKLYLNGGAGTKAVPVWKIVTSA